jgi:acyl-CoA reductase-like NAD-dependent aldehyde dehydrogenase
VATGRKRSGSGLSRNLKEISQQLGGSDTFIVLEDLNNIDKTVNKLFTNECNGESVASKDLLCGRSYIADEFENS